MPNRDVTADVAIVGAGPAGSWAAHLLASAGARVILFDHSHPREKPCGGGLTARALRMVTGVLQPGNLPVVLAESARFTADTTRRAAQVSLPFEGDSAGRALAIASRRDLDLALLGAAVRSGARHVSERVTDVQCDRTETGVITATARYGAGLLIGADGANSLVRRRVHRPFSRAQLSVATGFFAAGLTSSEIVIHCLSQPSGYIWSFPRTDHLAVGICAKADSAPGSAWLRDVTRTWISEGSLAPGAALQPYAWPIPTLSSGDLEREPVAGPRWLLLGDAAGLVDPLTREGIYFALKSGEFAAMAILNGSEPCHGYAARLRDEVHPELRRAALLARGFFQPGFTRLLIQALEESGRIREVMRDLIAGEQPYRGLAWRLMATREAGFAARVLGLKLGIGHRQRAM